MSILLEDVGANMRIMNYDSIDEKLMLKTLVPVLLYS